ncbi:BON domain-containing protein [Phenylobacterium soli]|uniref:BON domain-containing protein n=1 Tax=Phenylobacterium soli TaxID=2170551 RepID=A0A328ANR4_9CAUL|nr:BON domain-containing protein [Phenylobacterium soli]RAK55114.1 hypothetical protein DJ017_11575 [Phenylobacterium soli]
MADRWMDDRDRRMRERDWRRSEDMNRGGEGRYARGEDRSFGSDDEDERYYGGSGQGRDRVFGERDSGTSYGGEDFGRGSPRSGGGAYGAGGSYGGGESYGRGEGRFSSGRGSAYGGRSMSGGGRTGSGRGGWQDRDYGGVSPAMEHGEYDAERQAERYDQNHGGRSRSMSGGQGGGQGGRFYGDAGREAIYREEWSQGRRDYGAAPRGYDADREDHRRGRFAEDYSGGMFGGGDMTSGRQASGTWSGGTGGYDYERGYGDGGRGYSEARSGGGMERRDREDRNDRGERWEQRGREMGQDTGDFFRRAGERVASWFGGGEHESDRYGRDRDRDRDYRGMGPKGYKRADERISDEAHERLTEDPYVDASNISVSVSGGEVTLSGTVESREAKHRAERCVEDVSGVNHVQNNLRVDRGNALTNPGSGFGDSVLDHQMRGETGAGEKLSGNALAGSGSSAVGGSDASKTSGASADTGSSSASGASTGASTGTTGAAGRTGGATSTDAGKSR